MVEKYDSPIAETIDAGGNFINNVKQPMFILTLLLLGFLGFIAYGGGMLAYKYLDTLNEQKLLTKSIVELEEKSINLASDQKKLLESMIQLQVQNIDATNYVKREVSKNNFLVEKGNHILQDNK